VSLHLAKWILFAAVVVLGTILGFFLPPVSIILMTAPIILPPLKAEGFDLIWFGIVMSVTMEMGLIHPPVGLNIFVINKIAPDIKLGDIIWGTLPFVFLIMAAIVILCVFPQIATGLPDHFMGIATRR
jgi:C4-dicarboxylate transporter, DctM subunit